MKILDTPVFILFEPLHIKLKNIFEIFKNNIKIYLMYIDKSTKCSIVIYISSIPYKQMAIKLYNF